MIRILHTSDWHIGQHFYRFDREEEHQHFFQQLCDIAKEEQPDAMLVSGDVFHNPAPSAVAQRLFVDGVLAIHQAAPQMQIVITAGNHDSGSRLEAERDLWHLAGVHVIGNCQREENGTFDPWQFIVEIPEKGFILAVPYFHPSNYPLATEDLPRDQRQRAFFESLYSHLSQQYPVIMMAHLAVQGCNTRGHEDEPIGGMMKEDLSELGTGYDYLALGHIHMPQQISERAYYSGSAIPVSFSEDYPHSVNMVEIERHGASPIVRPIETLPLRKVKTLPANGAPLDEALKALQDLDEKDNAYIRLLVDQDEMLPADANDRANQTAKGKACRFCEVIKKPRTKNPKENDHIEIRDVEDFRVIAPMDIAQRSYEKTFGLAMNDTLRAMMTRAINDVKNNE